MKTKHITAAILALAASAAQADPFAITYTGTIANSTIPEVHNGERYTVTLVLNDDGDSANSAEWQSSPEEVPCVIWRMNNAGNVVFAQAWEGLAAPNPIDVMGRTATNAAGQLTEVFNGVRHENVPAVPGSHKAQAGLAAPVNTWFANGANGVFSTTSASFDDPAGGVQMTPARWTNPVPFTGNCLDTTAVPIPPITPPSPGSGATPVPTLGHAALALLGALVGGVGLRARRRAAA